MATDFYTFEYRFVGHNDARSLWSVYKRAYKNSKAAEKAAERERANYAECSAEIETRVIPLVTDNRRGLVSA